MSVDLRERAKKLAARPYAVVAMRDETTDGQPIYVVVNRELPGCMAQGVTIEEAMKNLQDARTEYILSLLDEGLPVPDPVTIATVTASFASKTVPIWGEYSGTRDRHRFLEDLTRIDRTPETEPTLKIIPT